MTDYLGHQLGNYRLLHLLGAGGFAEVYLGEHVRLGMQAAIKVLHTRLAGEDILSFQQEAQVIARLRHPHIIRVLDFDVQAGTPFLVLDYAPNGSLRQKYPRGSRLPLPLVAEYVTQIASALQYAHDHKLIHRDIKPENMLIGEGGSLLLGDFGIATIAHSTSSINTQSSMGTLAYMPPEQIQGKPRKESDQYALAVTVYQWLTGHLPFQGSSGEIIAQHLAAPAPPLRTVVPDLPIELEQAVLKALAKDPKDRYEQVQEFAQACANAHQTGQQHMSSFTDHQETPTQLPGNASPLLSDRRQGDPVAPVALPSTQQAVLGNTPPFSSPTTFASTQQVTPAVPLPTHSPAQSTRKKRTGLRPIVAITIILLCVELGLFIFLIPFLQPPNDQSISQNQPLNAYSLQDQQSQQNLPPSNPTACQYHPGGFEVTGAVDGLQLSSFNPTSFTACSAGSFPTVAVLVQATITIVKGKCAGIMMDDGVVELCANGTYSTDLSTTHPSSASNQGLNTANVVAFMLKSTDNGDYAQETYINGQDEGTSSLFKLSGPGVCHLICFSNPDYSSNPPDDPNVTAANSSADGAFGFLTDQDSTALFKDAKVWQVVPPPPPPDWLIASLASDGAFLILIWIIWLSRYLESRLAVTTLPVPASQEADLYHQGALSHASRIQGSSQAIRGGIAAICVSVLILVVGRTAGVTGPYLFSVTAGCIIVAIGWMIRASRRKNR